MTFWNVYSNFTQREADESIYQQMLSTAAISTVNLKIVSKQINTKDVSKVSSLRLTDSSAVQV